MSQEIAYSVSWIKTKAGIPRGQGNGHSMSYLFYIVFTYRRGRQKEKDRNSCHTTEIHIFQTFCHRKKGIFFTICRIHPTHLYTCAKWEGVVFFFLFAQDLLCMGMKIKKREGFGHKERVGQRDRKNIFPLQRVAVETHHCAQRLVLDGSSDSWKGKGL